MINLRKPLEGVPGLLLLGALCCSALARPVPI